MGRSRRSWTESEEKQWRSTFTRDNHIGYRKLAFELRNKGADWVGRSQKERADAEEKSRHRTLLENGARRAKEGVMFGTGFDETIEPSEAIRARVGVKSRLIALSDGIIEQEFDAEGKLVKEVFKPIK